MTFLPVTKRITTREEYDAATKVCIEILENGEKSARRDEYDLLHLLCTDYSRRVSPWLYEKPKSFEMLEFMMEQHGMKQAGLVPIFGSRSAVSLVLSGRRRMTLPAARALQKKFGYDFPALVLNEYAAKPARKPRTRRRVAAKV